MKQLPYKIYLPFTRFYKIWMIIILGIFIYNLIYVPFSIAFERSIPVEFIILDIITIIFNIVDIQIRSRTALGKNGQTNIDYSNVINQYINNGWFLFDIIAIIPIDYIIQGAGLSQQTISLVRLLRLAKLFRVYELILIIKRVNNISVTSYSLLVSFFILAISCHLLACVFFWLGKYEYNHRSRFDKLTLFADMSDRPFLEYKNILDMPVAQQYIHMLYFGTMYMT